MGPGEDFILGVNYWPQRKAMYWWSDFDAVEVQDEFDIIQDLGLDMVRIFLLWDDWQPAPNQVNLDALRSLEKVADAAATRNCSLNVTFFTGHMSGPSWTPRWMLQPGTPKADRVGQVVGGGQVVDCGYTNPYTDPLALEAEELLLRTVVGVLHDHSGVGLWNLGNEPDLFARPPTATAGRAWTRRMADVIHGVDPAARVTCGLHVASLVEDNGLRVDQVLSEVDVSVMHAYSMLPEWSDNLLDPELVPFFAALTSALTGRPTLLEETGACTAPPGMASTFLDMHRFGGPERHFMAGEEEFAAYLEEMLPRLVAVGATGLLLWCFADYHPSLYDRPPCDQSLHERSFGLLRADGSLKPHANVIKRFAAAKPVVQPAMREVSLDRTGDEYYRTPLAVARRLFEIFRTTGSL